MNPYFGMILVRDEVYLGIYYYMIRESRVNFRGFSLLLILGFAICVV